MHGIVYAKGAELFQSEKKTTCTPICFFVFSPVEMLKSNRLEPAMSQMKEN